MIKLGLRWSKTNNADKDSKERHTGKEPQKTGNAPGDSAATSKSFDDALRAATAARKAAITLREAPDLHTSEAAGLTDEAPAQSPSPVPLPQQDEIPARAAEPSSEPHTQVSQAAAPPAADPHPPAAAAQPAPLRPDMQELAAHVQSALGARFVVQRPLAIGGMATIFLLQHRLHGGLFAAKVLHPELAEKPGVVAGFRMEATHAAQLGNHPNAVPVFDFGEDHDLFYLLMPYIEGADLDRVLLKAGPLSREETLQLAAQISSLLCHAEALGIVHGDLTPGNIRLDIYGQYRLLDLGLSQARGPQDRPYTAGTPLYNSPEQLAAGPLDTRSDLYSLGAVLCECLSNRPAFHADTLEAIQARHRTGDWQLPDTLDEADPLRRLLAMLLSVDPAGRPQSAYELSGILHALGWARPEFRPTPPGLDPFMKAPGSAPRKRLSAE